MTTLSFFGKEPPARLCEIRLGALCPECKTGSRFRQTTYPYLEVLHSDNITSFVVAYSCEVCRHPLPVLWQVEGFVNDEHVVVSDPKIVMPIREDFDFGHVPDSVRAEIEEALDCLSVRAFNGFAAVCRRVIQAISTSLGASATSKVKRQIEEMAQLSELSDEMTELANQLMLTGHDGSHPHLPEVDADRAEILLSLLRDLVYELFTRPGKVREAARLRFQAQSGPD